MPFPLKHILLDKMLKDHGKVAVSSTVSCFLEINLTHTSSSSIFTCPTQTPFSRDESNLRTFLMGKYAREVCKQSELNLRKFETTSPQFSRKSDPNMENRQSRTGSNCGTLFCIQCSVDSKGSLPYCSFSRLKELSRFIPGRNAKWNRKFPEFPNFQKKGQP